MKADKAIYKCPCCEYCTHFPKALEAHQKFRKHFQANGGKVEVQAQAHIIGEEIPSIPIPEPEEDETIVKEIEKEVRKAIKKTAETEKKVRKPRKKAVKE